jgi:hypothetical protein
VGLLLGHTWYNNSGYPIGYAHATGGGGGENLVAPACAKDFGLQGGGLGWRGGADPGGESKVLSSAVEKVQGCSNLSDILFVYSF